MNPKLSIITVCYNSGPLLEETIRSVVKQKKEVSMEYMVIDGASNDETLTILDKYNKNIDLIISEADQGIYYAMNKGIKLARGELILFINAGDRLYDDALVNVVSDLNSGADIYYCNYYETAVVEGSELTFKGSRCYDLSHEIPTSHNAMIISRKAFDKYGSYNTEYKLSADYEWLCRHHKELKSSSIDTTLVYTLLGGLTDRNSFSVLREKTMIAKKYFGRRAFAWHVVRLIRIFPVYILKLFLIKIGVFDKYLLKKHLVSGVPRKIHSEDT